MSAQLDAPRPLRSDAQRNRERLLAAAADVLRSDGVGASLEEVARRAGVGIGTLYRHFPTRDALVEAVFEQHVRELAAIAGEALAIEDPWAALCSYVERAIALQAANRGLREAILEHAPSESRLEPARAEVRQRMERLLERGQASGQVRGDVTVSDLAALIFALGTIADLVADVAPQQWRRQLRIALDGLRSAGATPLGEPPMTRAELARMRRLLHERHRQKAGRR